MHVLVETPQQTRLQHNYEVIKGTVNIKIFVYFLLEAIDWHGILQYFL